MINEVYYILVAFVNDSRSILQREQHKLAAESDSSTQWTQSSAKYKWDTPFNRAMNIMMGHPPGQRPQC